MTTPTSTATSPPLRVHQFIPESQANGPGRRAVIWTQGCSLGCPGCFNPETHDFAAGQPISIDQLIDRLVTLGDRIEGVTLSGGEPFQQPDALLALLRRLRRETTLSCLIFTGFALDELHRLPLGPACLEHVDVLIAGRYDRAQTQHAGPLLGSANQQAHLLSSRYTLADLAPVPTCEVIITPDGDVRFTGIAPPSPQ